MSPAPHGPSRSSPRLSFLFVVPVLAPLGSAQGGSEQEAAQQEALEQDASEQKKLGLFERDHPLEAWQNTVTSLAEHGLELELFYTLDLLSNVDGGREQATKTIGNLDFLMAADLNQLAGWANTWAVIYWIGNHGDISQDVGDAQGVSNIEAPSTVKLFEAWIQKAFFDSHLSVLAGLYDVNSEFDVIPSSALFLNSSQGMGAELGNSGRNGPSTFPVTSLGVRFDYEPVGPFYARAVACDGVPGDPLDDKRTQIRFDPEDGLLLMAEMGYINIPSDRLRGRTRRYADELPIEERRYGFFGKFAAGIWHYTRTFDDSRNLDSMGQPLQRGASPGVYALAEQRVYYEPDDPFQGLSLYARAGIADGRTNPIDGYIGAGIVYRGLAEGRAADETGLAIGAAHFGSLVRDLAPGPEEWKEWELAIELTHRFRFAPWLSLQPDIQYVINPSGDPELQNATVIGVRALVAF